MAWVLLLAGSAAATTEAEDPWAAPGMYVSVGNHSLHVHCLGEDVPGSPTVVFESGLGGTSLDWSRVQPLVARSSRSCTYDRAGYGWSESGPLPRDAGRLSSELATLLVYASLPPPYVLVAHSFGGFMVRLYAQRHPDKVAGMVLVDTTHEQQFQRFSAGNRLAPSGRTFVIANHWAVPPGLPPALQTLARALALRPGSVRALYAELADIRRSAALVEEQALLPAVPIHLVTRGGALPGASEGSERRWLDAQHDLAERLNAASLRLARDSGHYVHLDAPELVAQVIRDLVVDARARAAGGDAAPVVSAPRRR